MTTKPLTQKRRGFGEWWDGLAEGWQQLRQHATQAITRFNPLAHDSNSDSGEQRLAGNASRWGLVAAELRETEHDIIIKIEVPGMERDDFDISVIEDVLRVQGEKRTSKEQSTDHYHLMECAYGRFERVFALPCSVDENHSRARYQRGVLTVTLPKSQATPRQQITIESD